MTGSKMKNDSFIYIFQAFQYLIDFMPSVENYVEL